MHEIQALWPNLRLQDMQPPSCQLSEETLVAQSTATWAVVHLDGYESLLFFYPILTHSAVKMR